MYLHKGRGERERVRENVQREKVRVRQGVGERVVE